MSESRFNEIVNCSKTYFFKTGKDFDNRIDWDGRNLKHISFTRGLKDDREFPPNCYSAYGTDLKKLNLIH